MMQGTACSPAQLDLLSIRLLNVFKRDKLDLFNLR